MRNLTLTEIEFVGGAGEPEQCTNTGSSSVGDQSSLSQDIVAAYEGLIAAAVYVAERVTGAANSL